MTEPYTWYGSPCPSCGADTWETWDRETGADWKAGWVLRRVECLDGCAASKAAS